jgi:hypothetical protein
MGTTYEVWCGRQLVALRNTRGAARDAISAFLRSEGCHDDELVTLGGSAVTWRGTIYRAVAVGSEASAPEKVRGWVEVFA